MTAIVLLVTGVLLLNIYAAVLVLLRGPVYGTRVYRPMLLNIGLSLAPAVVLLAVVAAMVLVASLDLGTVVLWLVLALGGIVWLLLLPNSAYLITELNFSHREQDSPVPLWYDIVLLLTLALSGVLNALVSIALAHTLGVLVALVNDPDPFAHPVSWLIVVGVVVLTTFGIYLGRYIRFNSWDVAHPGSFVRKLRDHFAPAGRLREVVGFCVVHSVLLLVLYLFVIGPIVSQL